MSDERRLQALVTVFADRRRGEGVATRVTLMREPARTRSPRGSAGKRRTSAIARAKSSRSASDSPAAPVVSAWSRVPRTLFTPQFYRLVRGGTPLRWKERQITRRPPARRVYSLLRLSTDGSRLRSTFATQVRPYNLS